MNKLDCIINDIQEHEAIEIGGTLEENARKRIEDKVLKSIAAENSTIASKKYTATKSSGAINLFTKKSAGSLHISKLRPLAVAMTLLFMLGFTATAAKRNEWDIALLNFMGVSNANTLQLESGEVQINQSASRHCIDYGNTDTGTAKEVTVTAASSIGDKNEVYIRIETDYVLPEDFNPETDYILPGDYGMTVSPNKSGYGSMFTFFTEDNKLGFLLSISNCEDINRAEISIHMEDFYLYHDLAHWDSAAEESNNSSAQDAIPEKELLCEGFWDLNWKFRYQSNTETYRMLRSFENNGVTYYLTKVEISPISIRMEAFRMPHDRQKPYPTDWLEEIHLLDGTVIPIERESSAGLKNGMFADSYVGIEMFGDALIPENVEEIVIMGKEIKLR